MSVYENIRNLSVVTKVTNGTAAMTMYRFAKRVVANNVLYEFATHVPGATGAAAEGICAMKPDARNAMNGDTVVTSIALPGGQALVELGEAVTDLAVPLRIGGNSTEVDGAAYLANATGDVIVAYPLALGAVGEIIPILFVGYAGTAP